MPSPKKTVPGFNRFSGLAQGIMRWAGARRAGNAASIPPNMFRDLENVRFEGQDIICRGGQVKYNLNAVLEGCIDGYIPPEYEPPTFKEQIIVAARDTSTDAEGTTCILRTIDNGPTIFDEESAEDVSALSWTAGNGTGGSGGLLWISAGNGGGLDPEIRAWEFDDNGDLVEVRSTTYVSGGDCAWGGAAFFDNDYFAVVSESNTTRSVVIIDPGGSGEAADRTAIGSGDHGFYPMWLKVDEVDNVLVAPLNPATLHYRNVSNVWATAAMPVGTVANRNSCNAAAVHNGALYFAGTAVGGGAAIFQFDTLGITQQHQPGGVPPTIQPLCSHNGLLWYVSNTAGTAIGYLNGATWTDDVFTFDGSDPVIDLISSDGKLYALRGDSAWVSEFPDTIWEEIDSEDNQYQMGIAVQIL